MARPGLVAFGGPHRPRWLALALVAPLLWAVSCAPPAPRLHLVAVGHTWSPITPGVPSPPERGVAAESRDGGATWQVAQVSAAPLYDVAGDGRSWVAVGADAVLRTGDGRTWTPVATTAPTAHLRAVAWDGRRWLALGYDHVPGAPTCAGLALTSADGRTWTPSAVPCVAYTAVAGNGARWVAVVDEQDTPTPGHLLTSDDGVAWTVRSVPDAVYYDVAWGGGRWVAVAQDRIISSADGVTWTTVASAPHSLKAVAWNGARWTAVGEVGLVMGSGDGVTWSATAADPAVGPHLQEVAWSGARWVAVGFRIAGVPNAVDAVAYTSADGVAWTSQAVAGPSVMLVGLAPGVVAPPTP